MADSPHFAQCLDMLRETDRDRYLACLLVPESHRGAFAALYAFNAEVARIRDVIREPMPGEVRLQWWRDLVNGTPYGGANASPVAAALAETIETYKLPRETFDRYIEARTFDLYDDPLPDRTTFEGYAGETVSAIMQLCAMVLAPDEARAAADVSGHVGVALAVAGSILLLPIHSRRGQVYVPGDILSATGLDRTSFLSGSDAAA
ncbi:MAG TPA: phytoene/squalene synthase family protein, partial [Pararhizobium sp.]|nr:phytoene/squalene synthase family protein [Pararhizobium sp.]